MKTGKRILATFLVALTLVTSVPVSSFTNINWSAFNPFRLSASAEQGTGGYQEFNGHYYEVFSNGIVSTWEEAESFCENLGGYLAVISGVVQ